MRLRHSSLLAVRLGLCLGLGLAAAPACQFVAGAESGESESASSSQQSASASEGASEGEVDSDSVTDSDSETTGFDPGPGELRVATFNVRLFFDQICQSGFCDNNGFEQTSSAADFQARARQIADAIRELDVHVVMLQEVENQFCIDALMAELQDDGFLEGVIGESGGNGSIDVATLAKVPFTEVRRHGSQALPLPGGGTTMFAREFLETRFVFGARPISVFNAHFKSKADDDPARRLAEAVAAERIASDRAEEIPEGAVILGGDLNDTPGSPPLDALEDSGELFRVASELTQDATHQFQGEDEAIDHLFVATQASGGVYVPSSARIFYGNVWGFGGSDHAALRATVMVSEL